MANGEMIIELREILEGDRQISSKTANRLTLAALADVLENQKKAAADRDEIRKNPMVRVGFFIEKHQKTSAIISILLLSVLVIPHFAELYFFLKPIIENALNLPAGMLP